MSFPPPPPQAPPFGPPPGWRPALPLADFWHRLGAYLIDSLILGAVQFVILAPFMIWWLITVIDLMAEVRSDSEFMRAYLAMWLPLLAYIAVATIVNLALTYGYFVEYVLRRSGQSLGKQLLKLQVIPVDPAARLTRAHLVKRWAVQSVGGAFVPFLAYLDGFWQLWDKPLQQCLHDKAAQTVVVRLG